jgi:hypothetical protein
METTGNDRIRRSRTTVCVFWSIRDEELCKMAIPNEATPNNNMDLFESVHRRPSIVHRGSATKFDDIMSTARTHVSSVWTARMAPLRSKRTLKSYVVRASRLVVRSVKRRLAEKRDQGHSIFVCLRNILMVLMESDHCTKRNKLLPTSRRIVTAIEQRNSSAMKRLQQLLTNSWISIVSPHRLSTTSLLHPPKHT